ncbi:MAG: transposase [Syntrophorhabdaceae bacterium]|nr:transposase [Syntrophorhabdaceae bacterium]
MPRHARLDAAGVLHHVIIRGIARKEIFLGDDDRADFTDRLSTLLPETATVCYAWALMSNHAHMLLRTGDAPLSTLMARLLTGYAAGFNRRHRRSGHLFQNRYKSIICQEEPPYLQELTRYIHLNPLRAGIVPHYESLGHYPWSGHAVLLGTRTVPWQDVRYILALFGPDEQAARAVYREFVAKGIHHGRRPELAGGGLVRTLGGWEEARRSAREGPMKGDERILGDTSFVLEFLARAEQRMTRRCEMMCSGIDIAAIENRVCHLFGISPQELYTRDRHGKLVEARSVFCFFAVTELGVRLTDLALRFSVTGPAIGAAVRRGRGIAERKGLRLV